MVQIVESVDDVDCFTLSGESDITEDEKEEADNNLSSVGRAIGFLAATVQRFWDKQGVAISMGLSSPRPSLLEVIDSVRDELMKPRATELRTATMLFLRGLSILSENPTDTSGLGDIIHALDSVDSYFPNAKSPTEAIFCFQIMCVCFLVLREPRAALSSIHLQMNTLFKNAKLVASLKRFGTCLSGKGKRAFYREDKALMDLLYSRVCAAVAVCEGFDCCTKNHKLAFQRLFLCEGQDGLIDEEFAAAVLVGRNWDNLRVFKMAKTETVAVAAVPAAATIVIDPFLAAFAAVGSVPLLMSNVPFLSKPLSGFDEEPNLYELRTQIMRICCGETSLGDVEVEEKRSSGTEKEHEIEFESEN